MQNYVNSLGQNWDKTTEKLRKNPQTPKKIQLKIHLYKDKPQLIYQMCFSVHLQLNIYYYQGKIQQKSKLWQPRTHYLTDETEKASLYKRNHNLSHFRG